MESPWLKFLIALITSEFIQFGTSPGVTLKLQLPQNAKKSRDKTATLSYSRGVPNGSLKLSSTRIYQNPTLAIWHKVSFVVFLCEETSPSNCGAGKCEMPGSWPWHRHQMISWSPIEKTGSMTYDGLKQFKPNKRWLGHQQFDELQHLVASEKKMRLQWNC